MAPFTWDDALALAALLGAAPKGVTLDSIAGYCDYVNHARPSEAELRPQLEKLISAGHARAVGDLYQATPAARKRFSPLPRSHLKAVDVILKALQGN